VNKGVFRRVLTGVKSHIDA